MIGKYTQRLTLSTGWIYIEALVSENNIEQLTLSEYQYSGEGRIRFCKLPLILITPRNWILMRNHPSFAANASQCRLSIRASWRVSIGCVCWDRLNLRVQCLDQESRHLVWMCGAWRNWQKICCYFGCNHSTAWQFWEKRVAGCGRSVNGALQMIIVIPDLRRVMAG